jgi:hypothetical protein
MNERMSSPSSCFPRRNYQDSFVKFDESDCNDKENKLLSCYF